MLEGSPGERRRAAVNRTHASILAAARDLITSAAQAPSVGEIAARAGVSRLSVYHHFGSKAGLIDALVAEARSSGVDRALARVPPDELLRRRISAACERWAKNPALFRRLPAAAEAGRPGIDRDLVGFLAQADRLRPGCSIREAEDVVGVVTSFGAFDRLHQDGRRSATAVADILVSMAASILATN
jgi:AcrR family transcriptional regulator